MRKASGVNLTELKGKIRSEGTSYKELAKELGVSITTLSDKINGSSKREFKISEISKLCRILNIESAEIQKYFFKTKLR